MRKQEKMKSDRRQAGRVQSKTDAELRVLCRGAVMAMAGALVSAAICCVPARVSAERTLLPAFTAAQTIALQKNSVDAFIMKEELLALRPTKTAAGNAVKQSAVESKAEAKTDFSAYGVSLDRALLEEKAAAALAAEAEKKAADAEIIRQAQQAILDAVEADAAARAQAQAAEAANSLQTQNAAAQTANPTAAPTVGGYVGLNAQGIPMSEKAGDVALDANGVPLHYSRCITGIATAYSGDPITATGTVPVQGTVAVDPSIIPYGTRLWITSADGVYVYGLAVAEDTGGFIYLSNAPTVDLFMYSEADMDEWGWRTANIYILD